MDNDLNDYVLILKNAGYEKGIDQKKISVNSISALVAAVNNTADYLGKFERVDISPKDILKLSMKHIEYLTALKSDATLSNNRSIVLDLESMIGKTCVLDNRLNGSVSERTREEYKSLLAYNMAGLVTTLTMDAMGLKSPFGWVKKDGKVDIKMLPKVIACAEYLQKNYAN